MLKKRILSTVCALAMVFASAAPLAELGDFAEFGIKVSATESDDNFVYTLLDDGTYEIKKYTGEATEVTIPAFFNGKKVTSIGYEAFWNCGNLKNVIVPNGVTSIGNYTFGSCKSLTSITIPNSVTSIGDGAFSHCLNLNNITLPDNITVIGKQAFWSCKSLSSLTIPNNVTNIGDWAFKECETLISITIPTSVTSIGNDAFLGCRSLTNINVDTKNTKYSSVDGVLYNKSKTKLICCPCRKTNINIPDSINVICDDAFANCEGFTSIVIPDSVTIIGEGAFNWCISLENITIPNNVTSICNNAFWGCTSLNRVTLGNNVRAIQRYAFNRCSNLIEITIPDSVTSVGDWAFRSCTRLTSITIPNSVTDIGYRSFGYYDEGDGNTTKKDNFIIYGYTGSEAEKYANDNGFEFIALDSSGESDGDAVHDKTIDYQYDEGQYFLSSKLLDFSFNYDDDWLFEPSTSANGDLAKACIGLASAAYKPISILSCLEQMGFKNAVNVNYLYTPTYDDNDHVCAVIGHKKFNDYDVYVVPIKGTSSDCEWFSNFNLGIGSNHTGFHLAAQEVEKALFDKLKADGAKPSKTIILLTGHSRGAAVANVIAGHLNSGLLEYNVFKIPKNQLFAYTFACPCVSEEADETLENIFNYNNPGDVVTSVPPTKELDKNWDYKRNGKTIWLETSGKVYERFLQGIYTVTDGESTYEGFTDTKAFVSALTQIAPDKEAYNSSISQSFFEVLAALMTGDADIIAKVLVLENPIFTGGTLAGGMIVTSQVLPLAGIVFPGAITASTNVAKEIGQGHTPTTYIEWVNAMYPDGNLCPVTLKGSTDNNEVTVFIDDNFYQKYDSSFISLPTLTDGEHAMTISAPNYVPRTYNVTVTGGKIVEKIEPELHLIGDVTGDGKLNNSDILAVKSHMKGVKALAGYAYACANADGDEGNKVNNSDILKMKSHLKGVKKLW